MGIQWCGIRKDIGTSRASGIIPGQANKAKLRPDDHTVREVRTRQTLTNFFSELIKRIHKLRRQGKKTLSYFAITKWARLL
eukprot:1354496-Karenia_brevis.AAC.1